ncbi:MAG: SDR family oxidoreductase [Acidimicrobiaceae bacterium]|nr:SDR family oxidoreductase [Acidimicrobiaceae bacterium]
MSLLEGRRAVVTGAGDIGSVVARRLRDHGASVEVWDSSEASLRPVEAAGIAVRLVDVTDRGAVETAAEEAVAVAPVNVLANTAAVARFGSVAELDPDDWQETLDVNLTGVYFCCRAFTGLMAARSGGSIINISSIGGLRGEPDFASYCASKFGVIGLTQSLAREVGSFGIRVNAVCPGAVESQMNTETMARDARRTGMTLQDVEQQILARTALGRLVQPDDVADAVVFLASDLSSCITGESLAVTGGIF